MSNSNYGYLKYILFALAIGFIALTPRIAERKKPTAKPVDSAWFQTAISETRPVLVKFGAEWCGPCRSLDAVINASEDMLASRVKIVRVDIDENPDIASQYGVRSIPHSFILKNGQIIDQRIGSMDAEALKAWVDTVAGQPNQKLAGR